MKSKNINLKPVTAENWKDCADLELAPGQEDFLPSNLYSIAEAQFYPQASSLAIYSHQDLLVGYAMIGREVHSGKWKIFRLMIDRSHQSKGYGTAALEKLLARINRQPDGHEVLVSYQEDNQVAKEFYAEFGFEEISVASSGKITAIWKQT